MKILVDARYLTRSISGIRMYSEWLLGTLGRIDTDNDYVIVTQPDYEPGFQPGPRMRLIHYAAPPVSLKTVFALHRLIRRERNDDEE